MRYTVLFLCLLLSIVAKPQESTDSLKYFLSNYQFKEALQWIDRQEVSKENLYQKAMCYKALGENKRVVAILKQLSEEYPDDVAIKTELAQAYDRSSRWKESSQTYTSLVELDSTNTYFSIKKSEADINQKDFKTGITNLKTLLEKDTLTNAIRLLGKSYETINKLDSAYFYYNVAWSMDSTDAFSAANLVNVSLKRNEYLPALALSQSYQAIDTTNKQMNMLHGYTLYALEDYENASKVLQKCCQAGDSSLVVTRSLGMSLFYEGKSDSSYTYLKRAYQMDTTNVTILYNLAVSAKDIEKYQESIDYHKALLSKLIPSDMQLYLNYRGLAIGYENTENYTEASNNYVKALEYATTDQRMYVLYPLAKMYEVKLGNKESALMYYNLYRSSLIGHLTFLKNNENPQSEINEVEEKLTALEEHIEELGDKKLDKRPDTSRKSQPNEQKSLFIVNGEVQEILPRINDRPAYQMVIYDFDSERIPDIYREYITIAKEQDKNMILIIEFDEKAEESSDAN